MDEATVNTILSDVKKIDSILLDINDNLFISPIQTLPQNNVVIIVDKLKESLKLIKKIVNTLLNIIIINNTGSLDTDMGLNNSAISTFKDKIYNKMYITIINLNTFILVFNYKFAGNPHYEKDKEVMILIRSIVYKLGSSRLIITKKVFNDYIAILSTNTIPNDSSQIHIRNAGEQPISEIKSDIKEEISFIIKEFTEKSHLIIDLCNEKGDKYTIIQILSIFIELYIKLMIYIEINATQIDIADFQLIINNVLDAVNTYGIISKDEIDISDLMLKFPQKSKNDLNDVITQLTLILSTEGPLTQGPLTQGPLTQGPQTQGPLTQGPLTQGPQTQGQQLQGQPTPGLQNPILLIESAELKEMIDVFNDVINFNTQYDLIDVTNGENYPFNLCYMLINNITVPDIIGHIFKINEKFDFFCINNENYILTEVLTTIESIHLETYNLFFSIVDTYKIKNKSNSIIVKLIACFYLYYKSPQGNIMPPTAVPGGPQGPGGLPQGQGGLPQGQGGLPQGQGGLPQGQGGLPLGPGGQERPQGQGGLQGQGGESLIRQNGVSSRELHALQVSLGQRPEGGQGVPSGAGVRPSGVPSQNAPGRGAPSGAGVRPSGVPSQNAPGRGEPPLQGPEGQQINAYYADAVELFNCYNDDTNPPQWSLNLNQPSIYVKVGDPQWEELAKQVKVYYSSDILAGVQLAAIRREPSNGGSYSNYKLDKYKEFLRRMKIIYSDFFDETFDETWFLPTTHSKSYYTYDYETTGTLPENIAMYIKTPVKFNDKYKLISVINCIGIAFDDPNQPDYKYFLTGPEGGEQFNMNKEDEYKKKLTMLFMYIFECAKNYSKDYIMLSYIGGGVFSRLYPKGTMGNNLDNYNKMFMDAFTEAFNKYYSSNNNTNKKIVLMGGDPNGQPAIHIFLESFFDNKKTEYKLPDGFYSCPPNGQIPNICFDPQYDTNKCLYVNAWNPHSIVGNTNYPDNIDGAFGSSTAMAFLSFPFINKFLMDNSKNNYVRVGGIGEQIKPSLAEITRSVGLQASAEGAAKTARLETSSAPASIKGEDLQAKAAALNEEIISAERRRAAAVPAARPSEPSSAERAVAASASSPAPAIAAASVNPAVKPASAPQPIPPQFPYPIIVDGRILQEVVKRLINFKERPPDSLKYVKKAFDLYQCYIQNDPKYSPPIWSYNYIIEESANWFQSSLSVKVYFTTSMNNAKFLIARREPVNIAMKTGYYDHKKYTSFLLNNIATVHYAFPHDFIASSESPTTSKSAYTYLYEKNHRQLPENIALFIKTPIKMGGNILPEISVLNCIGIGFDSELQPDFDYFLDITEEPATDVNGKKLMKTTFKLNKEDEYIEKLITIFKYIFICAIDKGKNTIMLSYIGGGAFNDYYPPGNYVQDEKTRIDDYNKNFMQAFIQAFIKYYMPKHNPAKKIVLIGGGIGGKLPSIHTKLEKFFTDYRVQYKLPDDFYSCPQNGLIPNICFETQYNPDDCLYVNAWDPHSIVGNGNFFDTSLDGYFGRSTAMGFLSCPFINDELIKDQNYKQVRN